MFVLRRIALGSCCFVAFACSNSSSSSNEGDESSLAGASAPIEEEAVDQEDAYIANLSLPPLDQVGGGWDRDRLLKQGYRMCEEAGNADGSAELFREGFSEWFLSPASSPLTLGEAAGVVVEGAFTDLCPEHREMIEKLEALGDVES